MHHTAVLAALCFADARGDSYIFATSARPVLSQNICAAHPFLCLNFGGTCEQVPHRSIIEAF